MGDGIDRPDWSGGDAGGGEHIESGRSVPINTPISRPDWGSAAPKEYVAGLRFTQDAKPVQRPDWGNGDWRTTGQEVTTPDTTHPLARAENAEVAVEHEQELGQGAAEIDPAVVDHLVGFVGRAEPAHAALDWLKSVEGRKMTEAVPIRHAYDFRGLDASPESLPLLTSFANHMALSGATQSEVSRSIEWYSSAVAKHKAIEQRQAASHAMAQRQVETNDVSHRDTAGHLLRSEWGMNYESNIQTINDYLKTLPESERTYLLNSRIENVAFGNDPTRLKEFLAEAKANQK